MIVQTCSTDQLESLISVIAQRWQSPPSPSQQLQHPCPLPVDHSGQCFLLLPDHRCWEILTVLSHSAGLAFAEVRVPSVCPSIALCRVNTMCLLYPSPQCMSPCNGALRGFAIACPNPNAAYASKQADCAVDGSVISGLNSGRSDPSGVAPPPLV
ncbi:hypothetical protein ASPVEDRAFT_654342 [Aspergillus versicolor CBS 583.65]|uniref:Uncharacterized protein n=1 Tax=Aspergillus versicolor CBS 583.65 TaxID=1036611 RepID=A0A1L9PKD3_ASPVE|nr:uncharacterized protein ASPVEDRAFT_654342 [Aspergillus versicolor CBS 583.65]OJJ01989.1 hypothetical protein ASPVEDRAFT_654342 [Aspergillus versicolor CBS 583.65]